MLFNIDSKRHRDMLKALIIGLWGLAVSVFLYFYAITASSPGFFGFVIFSIVLFGGGLAYHITHELILCPLTTDNAHLWRRIRSTLFLLYVGYLIAGLSLYLGVKFGGEWGVSLAFFGLITGMFWVIYQLLKLETPFRSLLLGKSTKVTPTTPE